MESTIEPRRQHLDCPTRKDDHRRHRQDGAWVTPARRPSRLQQGTDLCTRILFPGEPCIFLDGKTLYVSKMNLFLPSQVHAGGRCASSWIAGQHYTVSQIRAVISRTGA